MNPVVLPVNIVLVLPFNIEIVLGFGGGISTPEVWVDFPHRRPYRLRLGALTLMDIRSSMA